MYFHGAKMRVRQCRSRFRSRNSSIPAITHDTLREGRRGYLQHKSCGEKDSCERWLSTPSLFFYRPCTESKWGTGFHTWHLAAFVRGASAAEQRGFWVEVSTGMQRTLGERLSRPTWLSTEGTAPPSNPYTIPAMLNPEGTPPTSFPPHPPPHPNPCPPQSHISTPAAGWIRRLPLTMRPPATHPGPPRPPPPTHPPTFLAPPSLGKTPWRPSPLTLIAFWRTLSSV